MIQLVTFENFVHIPVAQISLAIQMWWHTLNCLLVAIMKLPLKVLNFVSVAVVEVGHD